MLKLKVLELPLASTAAIGDPALHTDGGDLLLSLDLDDAGQKRSVRLRFGKQRAFRKRSETYCTSWHVKGTFDTVCEVEGSDWVQELRTAAQPEWRERWVMRHFIIYVDSFGCLEVVAESASLDDVVKNSGGT
jgi:hypothetical protein